MWKSGAYCKLLKEGLNVFVGVGVGVGLKRVGGV